MSKDCEHKHVNRGEAGWSCGNCGDLFVTETTYLERCMELTKEIERLRAKTTELYTENQYIRANEKHEITVLKDQLESAKTANEGALKTIETFSETCCQCPGWNVGKLEAQIEGLRLRLEGTNKNSSRLSLALCDILISADPSWKESGEGHDWGEAIKAARGAIEDDRVFRSFISGPCMRETLRQIANQECIPEKHKDGNVCSPCHAKSYFENVEENEKPGT